VTECVPPLRPVVVQAAVPLLSVLAVKVTSCPYTEPLDGESVSDVVVACWTV
jgi:hypothetical protein